MSDDENAGVLVDIIRGKHLAASPEQLLSRRRLTWSKEYGWVYDVWAEDAHQYSQAGAYGRFSIPAIAAKVYQDGVRLVQLVQKGVAKPPQK